jgi:glycosyltransferase involved in cell wall biosynthesis
MSPPRVVFSHYDIPVDISGVSTWLRQLVPDLRRRGWDARVHLSGTTEAPGANARFLAAAGVPVRRGKAPRTLVGCVRQGLTWINEDQPHVYVPSCALPAYYTAAAARRSGLPVAVALHNDDPFTATVIEEFLARDTPGRYDATVSVSAFLQGKVDALGIPGMRSHRISYGVAVPAARTGPSSERFRLAYVGRLAEEQKRVSLVTAALCEVVARHPRAEAVIVGDGPDRAGVEAIWRDHPHRERVRLTGALDGAQVAEVLRECHALVLLSDYEGLPVCVLEAMAAGVVPICLRIRSGVQEVLESGRNGFLVDDRAEGFQSVVARLIAEPETWRRCSAAARETIVQGYSREACHDHWVRALEELLASPAPRFPLPLPRHLPPPHPAFAWRDDPFDRLLPWATPARNLLGRCVRRLRGHRG